MRISLALALLGAALPSFATAQEAVARPGQAETPSISAVIDGVDAAREEAGVRSPESFGLAGDCPSFADEATRQKCWKAYQEYFSYYESGFAHRKTVFWWQHVSTRIIFFVVLTLVGAGIYFAWVQFRWDLRRAPAKGAAPAAEVHHLEIGSAGVKVSSPVLGVVILVISLAFFYLYLVYVYPIKEIL